jgi:predicted TPR repeat methyltransferase
MCQPHIVDACVLDIGCGEGYCARKFVQMGAASVVGIDISEEMIKRANARASPNEHYFHGNAVSSNDIIKHNINYLPKSVKVELKNGCFDLVAGVFLFNYLNISQMKTVMCDTFRLLKPGGHFIFSVPNPMLPFLETANDSSFSFHTGAEEGGSMRSYFSSRDLLLSGTIKTLSGKSLNVRMMFKTLTDYIQSIQEAGLELVQIHEAKVRNSSNNALILRIYVCMLLRHHKYLYFLLL